MSRSLLNPLALAVTAVWLSSCVQAPVTAPATAPSQSPVPSSSAQTQPAPVPVPAQPTLIPAPPAPAQAPLAVAPQVSAAVMALLEQARAEASQGDADKAGATLERALRIEPNNPWLWHRLAVLRLQQQRWDQAIAFAKKSMSLAAGNTRLLGGNWKVIAEARYATGDYATAGAARAQSDRYLQGQPTPE